MAVATDFPPGEKIFRLPEGRQSARLRQALSEFGSSCTFRNAATGIRTLGIRVSFKTVERISEAVGAGIALEQQCRAIGASSEYLAPGNPAELLVAQGDGMRIRLREEVPACGKEEELIAAKGNSDWRECKVGVVVRCRPGQTLPDGKYQEPETQVQSYVATMGNIDRFGKLLKSEALRRGWGKAEDTLVLSDAGHGLPGMWDREFGGVHWTLDYQHVRTRMSECAAVVHPPGKAFQKLFGHWKGLLYNGQIDELLGKLVPRAEEHAPRPKRPADLEEASPGRILWTHIFYIEKFRDHMDYPTYRALGWFIASGHAEAACKMVGVRMKAANKRWTPHGAQAIATIIAERSCTDGRWAKRWPIPVYPSMKLQTN